MLTDELLIHWLIDELFTYSLRYELLIHWLTDELFT